MVDTEAVYIRRGRGARWSSGHGRRKKEGSQHVLHVDHAEKQRRSKRRRKVYEQLSRGSWQGSREVRGRGAGRSVAREMVEWQLISEGAELRQGSAVLRRGARSCARGARSCAARHQSSQQRRMRRSGEGGGGVGHNVTHMTDTSFEVSVGLHNDQLKLSSLRIIGQSRSILLKSQWELATWTLAGKEENRATLANFWEFV
ncbi:hypothetical protein Syun_029562 [Stephania yunnanensis]|uniref:Uncharacterized protein n=1 Tax=Stephania yunnanensis TaxID=152371 RepID=A0AAP0E8U4_9MAGN